MSSKKNFTKDAIRIKRIRKKLNMTQKQFVAHLGTSLSTISCIENGKRDLSVKMVEKIKPFEQKYDLTYDQMFYISIYHFLEKNQLKNTYINHDIADNLYKLLGQVSIDPQNIERYAAFIKNLTSCMLEIQQEELQILEADSSLKWSVQMQNAVNSILTRDLAFYKQTHKNK